MFLVSFQGFKKAIYRPSGESWAAEISGLPKNNSRSRSGGSPASALTWSWEVRFGVAVRVDWDEAKASCLVTVIK
jgi:hypothetical protein